MKFKKSIIITLFLLCILMVGAVSASSDTNDNITSSSVNNDIITHTEDNGVSVGEETKFDINTENSLKETDQSKSIESSISKEDILQDVKTTSNENTVKNTKLDKNPISTNNGEYVDITKAFTYLNEFRAEEGVWYWNKDDTTKTVFNTNTANQLKPLIWSSALEQTALIRAKEIAEEFSHTRPDNTNCFTAYPNDLRAYGENIAYGYTTCQSVTEAWKETNDPYSRQGHRRNILSKNFNCVGIAGYKVNGIIYWVQCFGYKNNIENEEPSYPTSVTKLNTELKSMSEKTNRLKSKKVVLKVSAPSVSNIYKKSQKFKVKVKNNGNPIKGIKVTIKVYTGKKYKKYVIKTNNKGIVTINTKKLSKGKHKVTIKVVKGKQKVTKKSTIKIKLQAIKKQPNQKINIK